MNRIKRRLSKIASATTSSLRKWRARVSFRLATLAFKLRAYASTSHRFILRSAIKLLATLASLPFAIWVYVALPGALQVDPTFPLFEIHLAAAGIIGTALALVLTISIVPAQKAADAFSTTILHLYARDWRTHSILALLTALTLLSVLLGTSVIPKDFAQIKLAAQFLIVGVALDALRAFYGRMLALLVPSTALRLVLKECRGYIGALSGQIDQIAGLHAKAVDGGERPDEAGLRWALYQTPKAIAPIIDLLSQLEEFGHKAIERRDAQASRDTLATLAEIGRTYADSRRDSLVLTPDFSAVLPAAVSDVAHVMNPLYEIVHRLCEHASKQPDEATVIASIRAIGGMAAFAMTLVHKETRGLQTVPLAFAPVFHLGKCASLAAAAGMEDGLLAATGAANAVLAKISAEVSTDEIEAQAIEVLKDIALASYKGNSEIVGFEAVRVMLRAARRDLHVRGFEVNSAITKVLPILELLIPVEVAFDKAKRRVLQTFPPYSIVFDSNIPQQLREVATRIVVDPDRDWVNPFHDFVEASQEIVHHFRRIADATNFEGVLLEKWVLDAVVACATVHMSLIENPPAGSEAHLDSVDDRLRWFISCPEFFFTSEKHFNPRHAEDVAKGLAILAMKLIRAGRLESAEACTKCTILISSRALAIESFNEWHAASVVQHLEIVARAADAIGHAPVAARIREQMDMPTRLEGEHLRRYVDARNRRLAQLEDRLVNPRRDLALREDPIHTLADMLDEARR